MRVRTGDYSGRRTYRRVPPRPDEADDAVDDRLVNDWPAGSRTLACLWCDRPFPSSGKQERMCAACRRHTH
ncbi:MAG TPA: hypothetical protein VFL90_02980 [Methylomirabilota bacterium]|nr:hypothetical protein [Methylomirabilota bacterium]